MQTGPRGLGKLPNLGIKEGLLWPPSSIPADEEGVGLLRPLSSIPADKEVEFLLPPYSVTASLETAQANHVRKSYTAGRIKRK